MTLTSCEKPTPQITIMIPMYNTEAYIEKCLRSIAMQTFTDFEVIIVDDGSTDNGYKIVEGFVNVDSRFYLIRTPNFGETGARQCALQHASGKYYLSVDSDDWIEPDMLETLYNICVIHKVDGICCGWVKEFETKIECQAPSKEDLEILPALDMLRKFYNREFFGTLTCYFLKAELWKGYSFTKGISVGGDMPALIYTLEKADKIAATNRTFYHYVQRQDSAVHGGINKGKINAYYFEKEIEKQVLALIPDKKEAISTWYLQNELYLLSAMSRSHEKTDSIVKEITLDVRKNQKTLITSSYVPLSYKISFFLIGIHGNLYIVIYGIIFRFFKNIYKKLSGNG